MPARHVAGWDGKEEGRNGAAHAKCGGLGTGERKLTRAGGDALHLVGGQVGGEGLQIREEFLPILLPLVDVIPRGSAPRREEESNASATAEKAPPAAAAAAASASAKSQRHTGRRRRRGQVTALMRADQRNTSGGGCRLPRRARHRGTTLTRFSRASSTTRRHRHDAYP